MRLIIALALLIVSASAHAGIYKCQQAGKTIYSDKPCPQAQTIDTTNAKPPSPQDQAEASQRAQINREIDQAYKRAQADAESSEIEERRRCTRMLRDHNDTIKRVQKYQGKEWWRNRGLDSEARLQRECGRYLIPAGAR